MSDRFDLLQQIGKGGMGTVWRARDRYSGNTVALKLLHPGLTDDPYHLARLEREVEAARRIDSPNAVRVLGYGQHEGTPYIVMELVGGRSLRELIAAGKTRDFSEWSHARSVLRQLANALDAAHMAGVIHRDIKPANVMIDPLGNVKLADFGIARAVDMSRMTGGETILGTPAYMAPDAEMTEQSDLYALGCVVYEMVTGAPPFVGETPQKVLLQHLREMPDLTRLPDDLREVVGWLLEKEPQRRPVSAQALLERLAPTLPAAAPALDGAQRPPSVDPEVPTHGHRQWLWVAAGLVVSIAVILLAAQMWRMSVSIEPGVKHYVAPGGAPTPRPVAPPAPEPGPPVIEELWVDPPVARPGETVGVFIRYSDPDGDIARVIARRVDGIYFNFGNAWDIEISAGQQAQWSGLAKTEVRFECSYNVPFSELEFSLVDANGGKSVPRLARFDCHE